MQVARPFIENLLAKGKLEAAIEGCLLLARHYDDPERAGIVAQHSARFHSLMGDYNAGTLQDDDYRPERARINRAMLDFARAIPAGWTDEALEKAGFSVQSYDKTPAPGGKGFLERWGLILGIVASLTAILGWNFRDVFFPEKKDPVQEKPAEKRPDLPEKQQQNTETTAVKAKPSGTGKETAVEPVRKHPDKTSGPAPKPHKEQTTPVAGDETFRSFAKTRISDEMERGYMGKDEKIAFRNVRTGEIICCFADAEDFNGGKAWVSKDGVNYFHINKNGKKLE